MRRIFSLLFWTFFALSSLVCLAIAFVIWVLTTPFDRDRRLNHLFSCAWASIYAVAYPGWSVRVHHRERIERGVPYLIVANHTSIADIVLCFTLFRQFKWVSKKDVFNAPILGWNMRMSRYIPLVRGDKESIAKMFDECRFWLKRGISVMMFPEGTRSQDGVMREFKHGAFTLAQELGVSVVPVAIHGGHALIPKHGSSFATTARLDVEVLEPMPPTGYATPVEYAASVRQRIAEVLARGPLPRHAGRAA